MIPCISGIISKSIRYSHYCTVTLLLLLASFFPSQIPLFIVSTASIYVRENENEKVKPFFF